MASRLQSRLLDSGVDVVIGPDSYAHLPSLLIQAMVHGKQSFDTNLNASEVYSANHPLFLDPQPSTQLTIMRGCDNMCSYCVVPYTRVLSLSGVDSRVENAVFHLRMFWIL